MANGFVTVGKVKDAHGIRGELFIVLFAGEATWMKQLESIRLVKEEGSAEGQTFAVKSIRQHKNGLIVKSADIKDRNHAELLKGQLLEIPEALLVSKPGEELFLREVLNFEVTTLQKGPIGRIVKFSSNTVQDLLVVKTAGGEFEIPFVKQFVKGIDYEAKRVDLDIPVGLLGELDSEPVEKETGEVADNDE